MKNEPNLHLPITGSAPDLIGAGALHPIQGSSRETRWFKSFCVLCVLLRRISDFFRISPFTLLTTVALLAAMCAARAQTVLGPWIPTFKGVDRAVGTNTPGPGSLTQQLQVANFIRVDLTDPDIHLYCTPRCAGYMADYYESAGYTMSNFLSNNGLQIAINANNFHDPGTADSPSYTLSEGTRFRVTGELICTGQVVSAQEAAVDDVTFRFRTNNTVTFVATNWPANPAADTYISVSGLYAVLVNGVNIGSNYLSDPNFVHNQPQPRTAFGLSQDRHYLYLITIDGRQPGYSDGALDWETCVWLQLAGAWDGANMDGGGSTCVVMQNTLGQPVELNHDSAAASNGRERTVGGHFGVYARPLPGMINDVKILPDDTFATVMWTTTAPASTQVGYGTTLSQDQSSAYSGTLVTNHTVLLSGLAPGTGYYFHAISAVGATIYNSSNFFFVTTNYLATNALFDLDNSWSFTSADLDSVNWTDINYDDSSWAQGPGLLWVDTRGFPNPNIPVPMLTQMPSDPTTGYPYRTYYFRTHFTMTNSPSNPLLVFHDFIDDGAVFYLNGAEIYRLRMPAAPALISNATLASGYPCSGDATCPNDFLVSVTNLLVGDNVLAVEVHNYNAASPDITFATALAYATAYVPQPVLNQASTNGLLTLSWTRAGFTLQQSTDLQAWTDLPGPVVSSPFTTNFTGAARFFRLRK